MGGVFVFEEGEHYFKQKPQLSKVKKLFWCPFQIWWGLLFIHGWLPPVFFLPSFFPSWLHSGENWRWELTSCWVWPLSNLSLCSTNLRSRAQGPQPQASEGTLYHKYIRKWIYLRICCHLCFLAFHFPLWHSMIPDLKPPHLWEFKTLTLENTFPHPYPGSLKWKVSASKYHKGL